MRAVTAVWSTLVFLMKTRVVADANYYNVQISELLDELVVSPRLLWSTSSLESYTAGVIILNALSNCTIQ